MGNDVTAAAVGIWGKHPSRPDFVRWNAGDVARLGMDRWLEGAFEFLLAEGRTLPPGPVLFLLPGPREALVGALGASRDSVGRAFPLAAVACVRPGEMSELFPLFPLACAQFLDVVAGLVAAGPGMAFDELKARAESLSTAPWTPLSHDDLLAYLAGAELSELGEVVGDVAEELPYGLRTLTQACAHAREGRSPTLTVDAPAHSHATAALWLELTRRALGQGRAPALVWARERQSRLLVSLGAPSPQLLAYVAEPNHPSDSLWPMRTSVAAAKVDARKALAAAQTEVLARTGSTMAELVAVGG